MVNGVNLGTKRVIYRESSLLFRVETVVLIFRLQKFLMTTSSPSIPTGPNKRGWSFLGESCTIRVQTHNAYHDILYRDEVEFQWAGNKLFLPGTVNNNVGTVYAEYLTGDMGLFYGPADTSKAKRASGAKPQFMMSLELYIDKPAVSHQHLDEIRTKAKLAIHKFSFYNVTS